MFFFAAFFPSISSGHNFWLGDTDFTPNFDTNRGGRTTVYLGFGYHFPVADFLQRAKLTMIMAKTYQGKGNIFIHTEQITNVAQESRYAFHNLLDMSGLPQDNVYLTGKTGFEICHDTGKVIVRKETEHSHNGCGKCKNCCSCHKRKAA